MRPHRQPKPTSPTRLYQSEEYTMTVFGAIFINHPVRYRFFNGTLLRWCPELDFNARPMETVIYQELTPILPTCVIDSRGLMKLIADNFWENVILSHMALPIKKFRAQAVESFRNKIYASLKEPERYLPNGMRIDIKRSESTRTPRHALHMS